MALIVGIGLLMGPAWSLPLAILLAIGLGLWAIGRAGGADDPGWVVIDEFAGQWIAMLPLLLAGQRSALGSLLAFGLFRLFDIVKPGPVGWADRQPGPFGVMADDVIAGGMAAALLWGAIRIWPGVF